MKGRGFILITGADGYIGGRLAQRLLATTDDPLLLSVRADSKDELERKRTRLVARLGNFRNRVVVKSCDVTHSTAFEEIDPTGIRAIVHAAAVTRFNVQCEAAQRVNVDGTQALLRFAERCSRLDSFVFLSTLYAAGLKAGLHQELPFGDEPAFANHYESSKWQAETLLLERYAHLPWLICRLATVIADKEDGTVVQRNAFHNSLRVYYHGLLSLVPGNPETPLYFITGNFATDAIASLMSGGRRRAIFHVSHRKESTVTLGELISTAFDRFEEDSYFRRKRILRPLFADLESFRSLSTAVIGLAGELVRQAAAGITPFAPQLFVSKQISNDNLVAHFPGYAVPATRRLLADTCSHLLKVQWNGDVYRAA